MGRRKHSDFWQESRRMRVVMSIDEWRDFDRLAPAAGSELGHRVRQCLERHLYEARRDERRRQVIGELSERDGQQLAEYLAAATG